MYLDDYFVVRKLDIDWVVERVTDTQFYVVPMADGEVINTHGMTERQVEFIMAI